MTFAHGETQSGGAERTFTSLVGVLAFQDPQKDFVHPAGDERGSKSWVHLQPTHCMSGRRLDAEDTKANKTEVSPLMALHPSGRDKL